MSAPAPVELAPHAVVRAARWPLAGLLSLGQRLPEAHMPHAQRVRAELLTLWQQTLGHERFRKAMAVSHPDLYARMRHASCPVSWNKSARQLVATLYRHWARGCWRTEPSGLWAGVGLAALKLRHESIEPGHIDRVAVAPHLQPFSDLLRALTQTPNYCHHGRFKVHPSAVRQSPGVWLLRVREGAHGDRIRRLSLRHVDVDAADRCIKALISLGPLPYGALVRVAERTLASHDTAQHLIDQLLQAQCLIGGLALPHLFESAWDALDKSGAQLQPTHRRAWTAAVAELRALCLRLEHTYTQLSADAVLQSHTDAAQCIESLATALGVTKVELPRACLHWDAGLPAQVQFDARVLDLARRAVTAHEQFYHHADPVAAIDQLHARAHDQGQAARLQQTLASHADWDSLAADLRAQGFDAGLTDRLKAQRCGPSPASPSLTRTPPFGALMLRVGQDSAVVQGLSHEPWLSYARFGSLLGREGPHRHPLHVWCDHALSQFSLSSNVRLAQLAGACAPLANLLAQPRFSAARPLDPYGTTLGALPDADAQLCGDGDRRWLQSPTELRPVLVFGASALDLGARDPLIERLLLTGWRYRPPAALAALRDHQEGVAQRIAGDVLLKRPRLRLSGDVALGLAHAEPADRWAQWQALAHELSLPKWITVSRDGEPALPMPRDSALAVEVMFRAPGATEVVFEIEVPEDECWLTDLEGNRYATELILVFARPQHAWNLRGHAVAAVSAEPGTREDACLEFQPC